MPPHDEVTGQVVEAFDIRQRAADKVGVDRLAAWLASHLGTGSQPEVTIVDDGIANGMSSSTLLFDLDWHAKGTPRHAELVARIAPDPDGVPVFPSYDLTAQFHTIMTVASLSDVPVPGVHWFEPTGNVLGQSFFVMDRVRGLVPPDMLPYTFGDNWLFDASDTERSHLSDAMIGLLADLHAIPDAPGHFTGLAGDGAPKGYLVRHFGRTRAWYDWSVAQSGTHSTLVEAALDRLEATLPTDPGETVLSWGDARIGNVIFDDFEPAAVLDWEMADLGPRALDVIWLGYSHRVFQDLAEGLGLAGLPHYLDIADVVASYEERSGHRVVDVEWHLLYAALRWACAFLRTGAREAHLNGVPLTEDGDSLLHNRPSLEQLIDHTFEVHHP